LPDNIFISVYNTDRQIDIILVYWSDSKIQTYFERWDWRLASRWQ